VEKSVRSYTDVGLLAKQPTDATTQLRLDPTHESFQSLGKRVALHSDEKLEDLVGAWRLVDDKVGIVRSAVAVFDSSVNDVEDRTTFEIAGVSRASKSFKIVKC